MNAISRHSLGVAPVLPRYPFKLVEACVATPFVLGPANGGLRFLDGFADVKRKEFGHLWFLRMGANFLPGYKNTYRKADKVLAGSSANSGHLVSEMKRHIETLMDNPEMLARMSAAAVERAREFTWERKAERTIEIYRDLIEKKRSEKRVCHA